MKKVMLFSILLLASIKVFAYPMEEIYINLDVASFNSSLRPKITGNQNSLPELGLAPPIITKDSIIVDGGSWFYQIKVISKNLNSYTVCFIDEAKKGSYKTRVGMVIRKYQPYYVAIKSSPNFEDERLCSEYRHDIVSIGVDKASLYKNSNQNSKLKAYLVKGDEVTVFSESDDFLLVYFKNKSYWIKRDSVNW
ncbi:MAG: hypothetical protein ACK5NC_06370 [Vibrio sp.]